MIGRLIPISVVVLALAAGQAGQASTAGVRPLAVAILRSMLVAPQLIDYEGTKIVSTMRGGGMETVTVLEAHKRPNKTRLEFLSPEPLAGRLIVDNGAEAWHYEPSLHIAFQGPPLGTPVDPDAAMAGLMAAFRVEVVGTEEAIGRPTFVLSLTDRHGGVRRIWVDQATGVPLRVEERGSHGPVYVAYFTRISFSLNLPEALFRFRSPAGARIFSLFPSEEARMTLAGVERTVGFPVRSPAALPDGLRLERAGVVRYGPITAAHLRYTDGATAVSVFQVPARRVAAPEVGKVLQHGGRTLHLVDLGYFKVLTWRDGPLHFTIVGAHPLAVLLSLAEGFGGR